MKTRINVHVSVHTSIYRGSLPVPPLRRLELVPYYGAAMGLYFDPLDLAEDRPLRFYHRMRHPLTGLTRMTELAVLVKDCVSTMRKRFTNMQPMERRYIIVGYKCKDINLYCSHLTLLCLTGFLPCDRRRNVVMHMNGDCMDDRPSNLRYGTQSENIRMSEKHRESSRRTIKIARAVLAERRRQRRQQQEGGGA